MLPQNKSKSITGRNFENSQYVNPIEDGNTPLNNPNQGVLLTSELNNENGYGDPYEPIVVEFSKVSEISGILTYKFTVSYTIHNIDQIKIGYYGNNLYKNGDAFTLVNLDSGLDFDYVKGYVVSSSLNSETSISGNTLYYFDLICVITEGLPDRLILGGGQVMKFDRRIYVDENSMINNYPINLNSSQDLNTNQVYFSWDDPTELAVGYKINVRPEYPTDGGDSVYNIENIHGNSPVFNGLVEPLLFTAPGYKDVLFSHKIVDRGRGWSFFYYYPRYITNSGSIAPDATFITDTDGGLIISEYEFIIGNVNSTEIFALLKKLPKNEYYGWLSTGMYVDLGIPGIEGTITDYEQNATNAAVLIQFRDMVMPFSSNDDLMQKLKNKIIKIHTGVSFSAEPFSADFSKPPIISYDKYPVGTKWATSTVDLFSGPGTYYWSIASIFDYDQKNYTRWSEEQKIVLK